MEWLLINGDSGEKIDETSRLRFGCHDSSAQWSDILCGAKSRPVRRAHSLWINEIIHHVVRLLLTYRAVVEPI
jgi:hypothetical protein